MILLNKLSSPITTRFIHGVQTLEIATSSAELVGTKTPVKLILDYQTHCRVI